MDRRHIELQIRAIVVTYRIEVRRRDAPTMAAFRARARSLLEGLEGEVQIHPDLAPRLIEVREELDLLRVPSVGRRERDDALQGE